MHGQFIAENPAVVTTMHLHITDLAYCHEAHKIRVSLMVVLNML